MVDGRGQGGCRGGRDGRRGCGRGRKRRCEGWCGCRCRGVGGRRSWGVRGDQRGRGCAQWIWLGAKGCCPCSQQDDEPDDQGQGAASGRPARAISAQHVPSPIVPWLRRPGDALIYPTIVAAAKTTAEVKELALIATIGVHGPDSPSPTAVGDKGNGPAIGRPGRQSILG